MLFDSELPPDARSFIIIGRTAKSSSDFLLEDLPSTSGRMDVLVRCVRSSLLISHGLRRDTGVFLIFGGPPRAPITVYIRGADAKYVRPDERAIATTIRKALARNDVDGTLRHLRHGVFIGALGLREILEYLRETASIHVLDESAADIRNSAIDESNKAFVIGDHRGFSEQELDILDAFEPTRISLGPVSLHADDVIAILHNELDRATIPIHS